jgi:diaminopimelate epimerase
MRDSNQSVDAAPARVLRKKTGYNAAMRLPFTKMHGTGNDYVYLDGFALCVADAPALARRLSDRHFGIGSDGLIIIQPPSQAANDCRMEMYNADGSRAQMCGNGIRCVAKYVHDRGIARKEELRIETDAGVKRVRVLRGRNGKAERIRVDMGAPRLRRAEIPLADGGDPRERAIGLGLEVAGRPFRLTAVSMGNPHAVIRTDIPVAGVPPLPPLQELPLQEWGPLFERHPWFPERTNTEFIAFRSASEMDFRVWERGSGETLACGTGACAAVVAGVLNGWCDRLVTVHLRGGDLEIEWLGGEEGEGAVLMTGPAVEVFSGEWNTDE